MLCACSVARALAGGGSVRSARSGVARVVMGLRHPLAHLRGVGEAAMLRAGIAVEVLGEAPAAAPPERCADALSACLRVNEVRGLVETLFCCACRSACYRSSGQQWVCSPKPVR